MTGTGTQTDPYIVDNWADFRTIDTSSSEIYVRWADSETKIIDFNDIQPEGFTETIKIPANVDFNGWTLKNLHSTAAEVLRGISSSNKSNVQNLTLENFYFTGAYALKNMNFENCIFSGVVNSAGASYFASYCSFSCISANLKIHGDAQLTFTSGNSSCKCQNADIVLDVSGNRFNITSDCAVYNSRFSGKIQVSSNNVSVNVGYSSVFNIESNQLLYCPNSSGISIFNSDVAQKTSNSNKNFVGVTTEQLKDAKYLASIGFPIGVE